MVAAHRVVVLEMADHGLYGGAAAHLAADGFGDTTDLTADPDLEPFGIVVAAIALVAMDAAHRNACEFFKIGDDRTERVAVVWIAMQRLGVQHELPPLGRGDRGEDRALAAELVGGASLAFADALHLGRMQRVDLRSALTLLLMATPQREIEQRTQAILERGIALDLAANVPDDAAEPGAQEFELPPGALELVGMRIAPHHDGGALGHAQIALAQFDTLAFGQRDQFLNRPVGEPSVGRVRDRLLLDGGIHHHALEILALDSPGPVCHRKALLQERRDLLLTQPLAPARQRRAVKWQLVPEHRFSAEILEIRVLYQPVAQRLVRQIVHVLEDEQPGHQPRWQRRLARPYATDRTEALRQKIPINLRRKPHQRMAKVDDRLQRRPKQVVLAIVARLTHGSPPTANLAVKGITNRLNPESQNARKSRPAPGFLAKSHTCSGQITPTDQSPPNSSRATNY